MKPDWQKHQFGETISWWIFINPDSGDFLVSYSIDLEKSSLVLRENGKLAASIGRDVKDGKEILKGVACKRAINYLNLHKIRLQAEIDQTSAHIETLLKVGYET